MTDLPQLLRALDETWAGHGFPVSDRLRPGLDPAATEQVLSGEGINVTQDLLDWFAWHDGAFAAGFADLAPSLFTGWSLAEAVVLRRELTRYPEFWIPTWFPLAGDIAAGTLAVDTAPAARAVFVVYADDPGSGTPAADGLSAMVELWLSLMHLDVTSWNAVTKRWEPGPGPLPEEFSHHPLVSVF